jgi:hypothetical protein
MAVSLGLMDLIHAGRLSPLIVLPAILDPLFEDNVAAAVRAVVVASMCTAARFPVRRN